MRKNMELIRRFHASVTTKLVPIIPKKTPKLAQAIINAKKKSIFGIIVYDPLCHKNIKRIILPFTLLFKFFQNVLEIVNFTKHDVKFFANY